jgi:hypothetical protein
VICDKKQKMHTAASFMKKHVNKLDRDAHSGIQDGVCF